MFSDLTIFIYKTNSQTSKDSLKSLPETWDLSPETQDLGPCDPEIWDPGNLGPWHLVPGTLGFWDPGTQDCGNGTYLVVMELILRDRLNIILEYF